MENKHISIQEFFKCYKPEYKGISDLRISIKDKAYNLRGIRSYKDSMLFGIYKLLNKTNGR